jgi:hypothetical protein
MEKNFWTQSPVPSVPHALVGLFRYSATNALVSDIVTPDTVVTSREKTKTSCELSIFTRTRL